MADLTDPAYWIPIIVSILAVIPLYLDWWNRRKISLVVEFELEKFSEMVKVPVASLTGIRILHPSKPIDHCRVFFGNGFLPLWDVTPPVYVRKIPAGGGANFRIPDQLGREIGDTLVIVMDENKVLRKTRLKDIPEVPP